MLIYIYIQHDESDNFRITLQLFFFIYLFINHLQQNIKNIDSNYFSTIYNMVIAFTARTCDLCGETRDGSISLFQIRYDIDINIYVNKSEHFSKYG